MKFSIIITNNRNRKEELGISEVDLYRRAIESSTIQCGKDFEIITTLDKEIKEELDDEIMNSRKSITTLPSCKKIDKDRNKSVLIAQGEYIIYLDIRDLLVENALYLLSKGIERYDWVYFNNTVNNKTVRYTGLQNGIIHANNICHKRKLKEENILWLNIAHMDWVFIQTLRVRSSKHSKFPGTPYIYSE